MTDNVLFVMRVSGEGIDAVYDLYVNDKLIRSSVPISEVLELLSKNDTETKKKRSFLSRLIGKIKKHGN